MSTLQTIIFTTLILVLFLAIYRNYFWNNASNERLSPVAKSDPETSAPVEENIIVDEYHPYLPYDWPEEYPYYNTVYPNWWDGYSYYWGWPWLGGDAGPDWDDNGVAVQNHGSHGGHGGGGHGGGGFGGGGHGGGGGGGGGGHH